MREDGGYTLLELLVVLAVIALVLSVAWTSNDHGKRLSLDFTAARLVDMLRISHTAAVRDAKPYSVTLSSDARQWEDGRGTTVSIPTDIGVQATGVKTRAEIAAITFFPQGGSTGGEIILSREDAQRRITIDWLTGRVQQDAH